MHQAVAMTLELIAVESLEREYTEAFGLANAVVEAFGEEGLADRLFNDIPDSVPFNLVCRLFDLLTWQTNDNGAAIYRTVERWLIEGRDLRKAQIALNLDFFPFPDEQQMYRVLSLLAAKVPQLADRCEQLISARRRR